MGRLTSGDLTQDTLRDAIIAGAQGSDGFITMPLSQGGPVFDATQALFGRRPARGTYNPETGQLEGGFGQYRSQLDAGNLTPDQLRAQMVQLLMVVAPAEAQAKTISITSTRWA